MKNHISNSTDTTRLAEMWDLAPSTERLWQPEELGAVLSHQLATPLGAEVSGAETGQSTPMTARDLLKNPSPSIEMLTRLKDFAKSNAERQDSALPGDVAKVLYCLAIAAALVRCEESISRLSDQDLRTSMSWAAAQPWVESPLRRLLNASLRKLPQP